jgi:hypothetical protein
LRRKTAIAPFAKRDLPITVTSYPTTSALAEWEERGETIIRKTFRPSTGGATEKRDRLEYDAGEGAFSFTELLCPPV